MNDSFVWSKVSERRNRLTDAYEPIQPSILYSLASVFDAFTFIDVGSNIGFYSVFMSNNPNIEKIIAFEPQNDCIVELKENIRLNNLKTILFDIFNIALSNQSGVASFRRVSAYSGASGLSETHLSGDSQFEEEMQLRVDYLDNVVPLTGKQLVIKVDVEGHEYRVLEGAKRVLSENLGIMQIEIHEQSSHYRDTFSLLDSLGWKKVLRVGWDYYFSNVEMLHDDRKRTEEIEKALSFVVENSRLKRKRNRNNRPIRRTIFPGVVLELSGNRVKKIVNVLRKKKRVEK